MTQERNEPAAHKDEPRSAEHQIKEALSRSDFVLMAAAVITVAITALIAVYTTVSTWTVILVSAGVLLALAMNFKGLGQARWFSVAAPWTVSAALIVGGIYVTASRDSPGAGLNSRSTNQTAKPPELHFVKASPATVPWCNMFQLTTEGTVTRGYEILVFDASADDRYLVTSLYSYDAIATPVHNVPGEWVAGPVYISSQYVQNGHGQNVLRNGKPISNAGYTVAVFAEIVPDSIGTLLDAVTAYHNEWSLARLPVNSLAHAQLDTVRNNNVRQCARPTG
jgi:hypothetical protein